MENTLCNKTSLSSLDQSIIWHPFTQTKGAPAPIPIIRGKGLYLYGEDGTRYLDGISSWWVNLHGHCHPYICERILQQAEKLDHLIFADFTHAPAVELASRILPLLPNGMAKIFYSDNGSTAVEIAIKMAIQFWHNRNVKKTKIVCFKNSYHGDTFGAMSAAGKNEFNKPFWNHLFAVEAIDPPRKGEEERSLAQLQAILKNDDIACFIFEPLILGTGGMIIYSAEGLNSLMNCCRTHQVLTIADEVMTGFGRTGPLFACQQLKETPDLICLAKGLTGGFLPLAITACTETIFDAFYGDSLRQAFLHGHSYTANPIACASALASLDLLLKEDCTKQRIMIEESHRDFCRKWHGHHKLKRCESLGTILVLEYRTDQSSYFQSLRNQLYHYCLSKGLLLRPLGNVLYVMAPYCIVEGELQWIYEQLVITLEEDL